MHKYYFYFDEGSIQLESQDPKQIEYINKQLKKNESIIHIPSDSKDWYVVMQKVKTYCIDKDFISVPTNIEQKVESELPKQSA